MAVDWLRLTLDERIVKDVGEYNKCRYAWQTMLDWSLLKYRFVYHQLARGHDKTERESWHALCWMLDKDHGQGFCCGADRDNARLFRDAAKWQVQAHGDLFADIRVNNYDIINRKNGAHIRVLASDESSNYGLTPDLLMITDFHAWTNHEFFDAIYTSTGKRQNSKIWIESNALALGTEQTIWIKPIRQFAKSQHEKQRLLPKDHPDKYRWYYYCPPGFLAPWQMRTIEDYAHTLIPTSFKRLIQNQDINEGDQYLTEDQVKAVETLPCASHKIPKGNKVIISTDLGLTKDAATVALTSFDPEGVVNLHDMVIFTGNSDSPVNISTVVALANSWQAEYKDYDVRKICDPYEMRKVMQDDPSWEEFEFNTKNLRLITTTLHRAVTQKYVRLYRMAAPAEQSKRQKTKEYWDLRRELTDAVLKQMSYGERVDHRSEGFTDRLMALGMPCVLFLDPEDFKPKKKIETAPEKKVGDTKTMGELVNDTLLPVNKLTVI